MPGGTPVTTRPHSRARTSALPASLRRRGARPLAFLGATALGLVILVLFVYPAVMVVVGAFRTSSPGFPGEWSVQGFVDAYTEPATYELLWNSTAYSFSVMVISLVLAVFFAWVVTQTNTPGRRFVTPMMVTLITLPFLFFGISWAMLGNSSTGLLNQILRLVVPVEEGPLDVRSWPGIVAVAVLKITAINYMLMLGVFRTLDPALREASLMAGVSRTATFFRIELPVLAPVLLALALMGFVRGLESFDVPLLLGAPAGIEVFSTQIYDYLRNHFPPAYAQASALSVLVMAIMVVLVVLMWRFLGRRDFTTLGGKGQRVELLDLGRRRYLCTAAIVAFALLALAFPLVQLVLGSVQSVFGVLSSGFTLDHYRTVLGEPGVISALQNTAFVVVVGGFLAVALATLIAYIVQRGTSKLRWVLEGATWLPWAVPGVVLGLGMLWAYLSVPGLRTLFASIWLVMLGLIVVATPVAVRLANAAIAQVHRQLEEAARVHGAGRLRAVIGVVLRLILPSLLAGWLICGVVMAGELAVPVLLSGPGSQTVPVVLLEMTESGRSSEAAAVFTLMLAAMAAALVLALAVRAVGTSVLRARPAPATPAATSAEPSPLAGSVPTAAPAREPSPAVPIRTAAEGD
jgi:iron(III) transport system permease protein